MNTPSPARNNSPSVQINGDGTYPDLGKRSNYRPPALSKRLADCRPDALGQKPQPSREIFEAGINPLTGAASGLLGFAIEIKHDDKPNDLDLLFQDLAISSAPLPTRPNARVSRTPISKQPITCSAA